VRGLPGPRSGSGSQEPGAGREGPAAQSRRRREPRHHADARAKYGGVSLRLSPGSPSLRLSVSLC
jgi:hypothetical protein